MRRRGGMNRNGLWWVNPHHFPEWTGLRSDRFHIKRNARNLLTGSLRTGLSHIYIRGDGRARCAEAVAESPQEVSSPQCAALAVHIASSLRRHWPEADITQIRLGDFKILANMAPPFLNPLKGKDSPDSMISSPLSQSSFSLLSKRERRE